MTMAEREQNPHQLRTPRLRSYPVGYKLSVQQAMGVLEFVTSSVAATQWFSNCGCWASSPALPGNTVSNAGCRVPPWISLS